MKKKELKNNTTTSKNFDYSQGEVRLAFNLRTDVKGQLNDFLDLLKMALKEVQAEIDKK